MAPRKKAEEKATGNEASDLVLHYLHKQNRPYSAIDVSANLHNRVTKAAAAKILKDLHEAKKIEGRAAGKQIVYHALQDTSAALTPAQLSAMQTQTTTLQTSTTHLLATAKSLRTTLASLTSSLSTADLLSGVAALTEEKTAIEKRHQGLRKGEVKMLGKGEREKLEGEWKRMRSAAGRRERIVREMWGVIEDSLGEREEREELREKFDLDG
ncbi:Tat binding protein 1-interacting [Pyrenochaeta sp. DS3sAY3a]|nr:Tat binding protein 1-interacting [Pyrenochaeta sp. DS3sAY3a]